MEDIDSPPGVRMPQHLFPQRLPSPRLTRGIAQRVCRTAGGRRAPLRRLTRALIWGLLWGRLLAWGVGGTVASAQSGGKPAAAGAGSPSKSTTKGSSRATAKGRPAKSSSGITADLSGPVGVFTSRQIELHTDLDREAAEELVERLETELALIGKYWGRPASGVFEMYVVADLSKWPRGLLAGEGLAHIESGGGVTIGQTRTDGTNFVAKSRVYAVADRGTPQHELVHAYCVQTFGRVGPVWYAEGMAEMGQYWRGTDRAVLASQPVIRYLRESPLVPLDEIVHGEQKSGDSWKNYAWRWALCHLLANNPNYSPRFRPLGVALLTGQRTSFDNVYGSLQPEIEFEYREFLKHLGEGLRVDLTAWNWQAKFKATSPRSTTKARVEAARGWQPSRLTLKAGDRLSYSCSGQWKLGRDSAEVEAAGDAAKAGRLLGVLLTEDQNRYELGEPFELGSAGEFSAPGAGRLYLRCQDRWTELADNSGFVTVEFQCLKESSDGSPPTEAAAGDSPCAASAETSPIPSIDAVPAVEAIPAVHRVPLAARPRWPSGIAGGPHGSDGLPTGEFDHAGPESPASLRLRMSPGPRPEPAGRRPIPPLTPTRQGQTGELRELRETRRTRPSAEQRPPPPGISATTRSATDVPLHDLNA